MDNKIDPEEYYVQRNGDFLGNSPFWWAKDGKGYTAYILGAERFTKEAAETLLNGDPQKWAIYKCSDVDARLHLVYDSQDHKRLGTDAPCGWASGYAMPPSAITALQSENAELKRQLEEAGKDAGRWEQCTLLARIRPLAEPGKCTVFVHFDRVPEELSLTASSLFAREIDAAIAAQGGR